MASGCFDQVIRVWNVNQRKVIDWQQTPNYITALQSNKQGDKLVVGLVDGVCIVFDYSPQKIVKNVDDLKHEGRKLFKIENKEKPVAQESSLLVEQLKRINTISVKNSKGKFSSGRKVTGIEFFDDRHVMVTTNDSRVRFVNIISGKTIAKLKGHKNESYHVRANLA